ncbi:hypothetical protein VIGAN_06049100 [Vigna angularis var. angularis]|uniref:Uncharacterized protein n=1 Tax=Vigna angularis var. angularis TaxID=157739 RepID=A0A0S3S9H5_PHAAN|nr:hypothetical protein VIGAN_06049100 [Vigna angularis var. angularis]
MDERNTYLECIPKEWQNMQNQSPKHTATLKKSHKYPYKKLTKNPYKKLTKDELSQENQIRKKSVAQESVTNQTEAA